MITLRPVQAADADALYPLIYKSIVTETIAWDGPEALDTFRSSLAERAQAVARGNQYLFTIIEQSSGKPIGSASIRPDEESFRGDIGLWIGQHYHGRGYGAQVVRKLVEYGFEHLGMGKIEGYVFVGNWASRRIFEKNGFQLEGRLRKAVLKRGVALDEWVFGITSEEWLGMGHIGSRDRRNHAPLLHICTHSNWQHAQQHGTYAPASLEEEGFIHCSRPEQLLEVANYFYRQSPPLVVLWIAPSKVNAEIRWEAVGQDNFPHIYGPLNLDAVDATLDFPPEADGVFRVLPQPINPGS